MKVNDFMLESTVQRKTVDPNQESELLKKHTDFLLSVLERMNEIHIDQLGGGPLYDQLSLVTTEKNLLVTPFTEDIDIIPTITFREITISEDHLRWVGHLQSVTSEKNGNVLFNNFLKLTLYPYAPKFSSPRKPYLDDSNSLFNLESSESYNFYSDLFGDGHVENSFIEYYEYVISQTLDKDADEMKNYSTAKYRQNIFLTWTKVKNLGTTYKNPHNKAKPEWLNPVIERHLHLVLVVFILRSNYIARCFLNENHHSLLKLLSRKCFHRTLEV